MDPLFQYACLAVTGIIAGTESGLFGVGGGSLMTPVQFWLYSAGGMDTTLATRIAFGTSLAVIIPTMISGALAHHKHGVVDWKAAVPMGCAAVFGGLFGGTLAAYLPGFVLRVFFAIFLLIMAVRMVWHIRNCTVCEPHGTTGQYLLIGFLIGVLSGLTGLGGGALLVPILVILLGYPIHRAGGTPSACRSFSCAGAMVAYIANGIGLRGRAPDSSRDVELSHCRVLAARPSPS
ncbi:sulfite exporter TauE/SafE family protein, partial [Methanoregula sp.]|uniref:sulfite exporter TauE/SafE family protein n=1 Tax=Methanoregula sp. TaxID=2052170 RepID=UPI000CBC6F71